MKSGRAECGFHYSLLRQPVILEGEYTLRLERQSHQGYEDEKERNSCMDVIELPEKKKSHLFFLGQELDSEVQACPINLCQMVL